MKLGMSCYCLDPAMASGQMSVDDVVDYAVAHGCEHIEFVPFRLAFVTPERTLDWELIDHVREKCKSAGIEISTYSVNADLLKTDPEEEEREIERVKRHIDAAQGLGLSRMRFDVASFRRPFSTNTIYDFNREFPQMVKNGTILC
ncbi:sugar phosphate isomerase/epimerase, partial [uncultured Acetatifactor sp.]